MNAVIGWKSGYDLSAFAVFVGSAFLFLTDVRRRRLSRRKTPNSSMKTYERKKVLPFAFSYFLHCQHNKLHFVLHATVMRLPRASPK
jgi:hypothetical protein